MSNIAWVIMRNITCNYGNVTPASNPTPAYNHEISYRFKCTLIYIVIDNINNMSLSL